MKRGCATLGLLIICCVSLSAMTDKYTRGINLKLAGGYGTYSVGDFNTFFKDTVPYYDVQLFSLGFIRHGDYRELKNAWNISGEFLADVTKNISVGFGIGYCQAENQSSFYWTHPEYNDLTIEIMPSFNVIPVKFNLYFAVPLMAKMKTYLNGGLGIYMVSGIFEYLETSQIPGQEGTFESNITADGTGFGFHGGLGLEFNLSSRFSVFVEGIYRSAKLDELNGRMSIKDYTGANTTVGGRIWYFEYLDETTDQYLSGIRIGEKPEDDGLRVAREFEFDLSGFSFIIGIKIRFGIWEQSKKYP